MPVDVCLKRSCCCLYNEGCSTARRNLDTTNISEILLKEKRNYWKTLDESKFQSTDYQFLLYTEEERTELRYKEFSKVKCAVLLDAVWLNRHTQHCENNLPSLKSCIYFSKRGVRVET